MRGIGFSFKRYMVDLGREVIIFIIYRYRILRIFFRMYVVNKIVEFNYDDVVFFVILNCFIKLFYIL